MILVVEDERMVRELILRVFRDRGYRAEGAANGLEALALLKEGLRPRVVLLDIGMPHMDGNEFLEAVKAYGLQAPTIVLSGCLQELHEEHLAGVTALAKPPDWPLLLRLVEETVGMAAQE